MSSKSCAGSFERVDCTQSQSEDPFGSSTFILYSTIQGEGQLLHHRWLDSYHQFILAYSRMPSYSFDLKLCESGACCSSR